MLFIPWHKKSYHILQPFWALAITLAMRFFAGLAIAMQVTFNVWTNAGRIDIIHSQYLLKLFFCLI
jgi:hypothetical protein